MQSISSAFTVFITLIVGILFLSFLLAWPVMMLWNNCLVGAIDGVKSIGWLQAWGIQFLFALLFKTTLTKK